MDDRPLQDWIDEQNWLVLDSCQSRKWWSEVTTIDHIVENGSALCSSGGRVKGEWSNWGIGDRHCRNCLRLAEKRVDRTLQDLDIERDWPETIDLEELAIKVAGQLPAGVFLREGPLEGPTPEELQLRQHMMFAHGNYNTHAAAHSYEHDTDWDAHLGHSPTDLRPLWQQVVRNGKKRKLRQKPWWMR